MTVLGLVPLNNNAHVSTRTKLLAPIILCFYGHRYNVVSLY
jgi:hypothetical protein